MAAGQADMAHSNTQLLRLNEAIKANPDSHRLLVQRAKCHLSLKHYHEAMDDAIQATKLDELDTDGWIVLGDAWMRTKHYKGALSAWVRASELDQGLDVMPRILEAEQRLREANEAKYAAPAAAAAARHSAPALT